MAFLIRLYRPVNINLNRFLFSWKAIRHNLPKYNSMAVDFSDNRDYMAC